MQPTQEKITFTFLKQEIQNEIEKKGIFNINAKVQQLTERLLEETSYEEIVQLNKVVQSQNIYCGSTIEALSVSTLKELIKRVKEAKPELDKLKNAVQSIDKGQLDEAVLILASMDSTFKHEKNELRQRIANKYRENGEHQKADKLMGIVSKPSVIESPAETIKAETGIGLVNAGMNNLRRAIPDNNLPSNRQMEEAVRGLHNMSLNSAGRVDNSDLKNEPIEILKEKLKDAEHRLELERKNYNKALQTRDPNIFMPALAQKQEVMNEIISIKWALHNNGIDQSDKENPAELLSKALQDGFKHLQSTVSNRTNSQNMQQEDCIIM